MLKKRLAALAVCFILISTLSCIFVSAADNAAIPGVAETATDVETATDAETATDVETDTEAPETDTETDPEAPVDPEAPETGTDEGDGEEPTFFEKIWNFLVKVFNFIISLIPIC